MRDGLWLTFVGLRGVLAAGHRMMAGMRVR
jgi:hypothetical protein